jgi:hypothetical protein
LARLARSVIAMVHKTWNEDAAISQVDMAAGQWSDRGGTGEEQGDKIEG